jgi:hypothetical protein
MKKLFLIFMLIIISALPSIAQNNATLVLWHADGTTTDVALYLMPKVEFQNDKVRITSTVLDMEYPKSDILRFSYKGSGTGITAPKNEANYSQEGDRLVFHGIMSADKVAVYTANGIRVPARLTATADGVALSLSSIPQGVYVLSVNGKTSKFTRP